MNVVKPRNSESTPGRSIWRRLFVGITSFSLLVMAIGYVKFTVDVSNSTSTGMPEKADAIVVLTGGRDRIRSGIMLLQKNIAGRLLITGVHPNTSNAVIRASVNAQQNIFDCCVEVDRLAQDTVQNAYYASMWVKQNKFKSLVVVTSNYHMPRSLLLMRRSMPGVKLIPAPVNSHENTPHFTASNFRVTGFEFIKYLAAWLHISG